MNCCTVCIHRLKNSHYATSLISFQYLNLLKTVKGDREVFDKAHWTVKYPPKDISRAEYAACVYLETALSYSGLREHYGKQRKERNFQNMVDKHMNPAYEKFQKEKGFPALFHLQY